MRFLRTPAWLLLAGIPPISIYGQQPASPTCNATAVPAQIRAEGVAERMGDIVLACTAAAGREVTGNLTVSINTTVTNRVLSNSTLDVLLSVNGAPANASATLGGNNQVTFNGLRFTVPQSGAFELRVSNLRGDASFGGAPQVPPQFGGGQSFVGQPITAQLAFTGGSLLNFTNSNLPVGVPQRGLYATTLTSIIPNQLGSPLPATIGFNELINEGTAFASTRITEGYAAAFETRQPQADTGTRIMLRFSGYPADARLFVPAAIAGSDAAVPTAAGDFGGTVSGGRYVSGSRTLLLVRVLGTDANGAGGYASQPGAAADGTFNTMTEVQISSGSGFAVYEVADSNPQAVESAQIPLFIGLPASGTARNVTLGLQTSFAPVSTTATATAFAPIPRFAAIAAPTDCSVFQDCSSYIPRLDAPPVNTTFTLVQGIGQDSRLIPLSNAGGGLMPWTATVEYKGNATGWIRLTPTSGLEPLLIRMFVYALPEMQPGTYEATVVIDAGSAGVAQYPVSLRVVGIPAPPPPAVAAPTITAVQNGATFQAGSIAPGSYITLRGTNFTSNSAVAVDNKPARVAYASTDQINVLAPNEIGGNSTQIVVTANNIASAPAMVNVAAVAPGIFTPGIVNQEGSISSATNPANTGSYISIYATGLLPPDGSGVVEAKLHDRILTNLPYAGPAPGIPGLQQVNLQVPQDLPTMQTEVLLCTTVGGQRACSPPVKIWLRNAQ